MVETILIGIGALGAAAAAGAFAITRDGSIVTPQGSGTVTTQSACPDRTQPLINVMY